MAPMLITVVVVLTFYVTGLAEAHRISRRWHARAEAAVAARRAGCVPQQPTSAAPPVLVGVGRVVVAGCPETSATTTHHHRIVS